MPGFNEFLVRIQTDYRFYLQFRNNSDEALASYKLSPEETAALKDPRSSLWSRMRGVPANGDELYPDPLSDNHVDVRLKTYNQTNHIIAGDSVRNEFNAVETLKRPEIERAIVTIRGASTQSERKAGVSFLVNNIR